MCVRARAKFSQSLFGSSAGAGSIKIKGPECARSPLAEANARVHGSIRVRRVSACGARTRGVGAGRGRPGDEPVLRVVGPYGRAGAYVCARVSVCLRARVCVCTRASVCARTCVCVSARNKKRERARGRNFSYKGQRARASVDGDGAVTRAEGV